MCVQVSGFVGMWVNMVDTHLQRCYSNHVSLVARVCMGLGVRDLWVFCVFPVLRVWACSCKWCAVLTCGQACASQAPVGAGLRRAEW